MTSAERGRELLLAVAQELVPETGDPWPAIRERARQARPSPAAYDAPATAPGDDAPGARAPGPGTRRPRLAAGLRHLARVAVAVLSIGLVAAIVALVIPGLRQRGNWPGGPATTRTIAYGFGASDRELRIGGFAALDLATGTIVGQVPAAGGQGAAWALAPDGRRAYLLEDEVAVGGVGWRLTELETPSLRVVRRTPIPNAARPLGIARTVAVSPDGREVYVVTLESRANPGGYAQSDRDAITGIAVYDVSAGKVARTFTIGGGYCGPGPLFALAGGTLLVGCGVGLLVINSLDGRTLFAVSGTATGAAFRAAGVAVSPDGRSYWIVDQDGQIRRGDLATRRTTASANLAPPYATPGGTPGVATVPPDLWIPIQEPQLSADGTRLYILGAPTARWAELGASTLALVVDATSLAVIGVVPLPMPTTYLAPVGNGAELLSGGSQSSPNGLRLIAVPDGRELRSWPGPTQAILAREAPGGSR